MPRAASDLEILPVEHDSWETVGRRGSWRTAIGRLSDRVRLHPRQTVTVHGPVSEGAWVVSVDGSITAADVHVGDRSVFTAVSVYAPWEMAANRGYADASAHRILSDLSALVGSPKHRLVVAGDWNILRGYGEYGNSYWKGRYDTVFERARALGLRCVGPVAPNGRQAEPWPEELPLDSRCVPTFHHSRQSAATATRQLDFVFVSESLADAVDVRAANSVEGWGPSDHCRVIIDLEV